MQNVTLRLPDPLYQQLKRRAEQTRRSVEDEVLEVVAGAVPLTDLPQELADAISPLVALDDAALWRAARTRLPVEASERLEELNLKRQREGLTQAEDDEAATLLRGYDRAMLVRAQAAVLLQERGHDISILLSAA